VNTLSPLNPDTKPDQLPENPITDTPAQPAERMAETPSYVDYNVPDIEVEPSIAPPSGSFNVQNATPAESRYVAPAAVQSDKNPVSVGEPTVPSSGFLVGYITSLFAGTSMLYGLSTLGFILLDHFINRPDGVKIGGLYDASSVVSSWHVWLIASLVTFTALYLVLSRAAGKRIAAGLIPERQMQAAEVARSIFTAILVITSATLVASLLFTLLNGTLAAAEIEIKDIVIQIAGTIATFIWVGAIVWHQTTIHRKGRNGLAGVILASVAVILAVVASIFLLAAGRNAVIDSHTMSDLSTIQSKLMSYKSEHNNTYPDNLSSLDITDEAVKKRLGNYTYTHIVTPASTSSLWDDTSDKSSGSMYDMTDMYSTTGSPSTTTSSYKLCANFLTDDSKDSSVLYGSAKSQSSTTFYGHGKGEHCVETDI
jgi:type II secretory pathway pseudopilin PulG